MYDPNAPQVRTRAGAPRPPRRPDGPEAGEGGEGARSRERVGYPIEFINNNFIRL